MSEKKPKPAKPTKEIVALDINSYNLLKKEEEQSKAQNAAAEAGEEYQKQEDNSVLGLILKTLKTQSAQQAATAERMSFEVDPKANYSGAMGFYKLKQGLTPDHIIKRITGPGGDELVNQILQARSNHAASFGRPRTDRFSMGLEFQDMDKNAKRSEEQQRAVQERIDRAKNILWRCGQGTLDDELTQVNLSQFFKLITRDGLGYGRFAVERIWKKNLQTDENELYAWRAADGGTMYKILPQKERDQSLRLEAVRQLAQLKNKKIDIEKYKKDQYRYVQVIEGKPEQAFTEDELVVYNMYPTTNVEYNGYPLTPIDQALNAITTHINITIHNKLYFQHGRAAKGMLIFKSDSVDEAAIQRIRLQFHQSINSVQNSWRMPVFGVGSEDELSWQGIDVAGRDAEFQYLMDNNARVILSSFQMSPEELPGYAHLARGTNTQALSECLHEDTRIITPNGLCKVGDLAKDGPVQLPVWNGKKFVLAKIFYTGPKALVETVLTSNLSIKTSPDHYFRTVDSNGELSWTPQARLSSGDAVLLNKLPVPGSSDIPQYKGRQLTLGMMEVLGWAIGDGSLNAPKKRAGGYLKLFYHQSKERDLWSRHAEILQDFGLAASMKEKTITPDQQDSIKNRYGFKTVAASRISTYVYDTDFVRWLQSLGFSSSDKDKTIPDIFYTMPIEYRQAFMKGLFSADGHVSQTANGQVTLTVSSAHTQEHVRNMLITLGIRTTKYAGTTKEIWVGLGRDTVPAKNKIVIKDKRAFYAQVGFLQKHKQPQAKWLEGSDPSSIPMALQSKYVNQLISSDLPREHKSSLYSFTGPTANRMSLNRLGKLCAIADIKLPDWVNEYHFDSVAGIIDHHETVGMYDVTMHDDSHEFIANGIVVHNSDNEWKLTAARDVGLRPMLHDLQDFMNTHILPFVDAELAKTHQIVLAGLDKDSPEKENTRLQQDMNVHMTYNEIMKQVEKNPVPVELGGSFPMNPQFQAILDKYMPVGVILENFFKIQGAGSDPRWQYIRDPFYFQQQQMTLQKAQIAMQQQMMAQQQMQQQAMAAQGNPEQGDEGQDNPEQGDSQNPAPEQTSKAETPLDQIKDIAEKNKNWATANYQVLEKTIKNNHDAISRRLLQRHTDLVDAHMEQWKKESKKAAEDLAQTLKGPNKKEK
jgi:hypothetical protein